MIDRIRRRQRCIMPSACSSKMCGMGANNKEYYSRSKLLLIFALILICQPPQLLSEAFQSPYYTSYHKRFHAPTGRSILLSSSESYNNKNNNNRSRRRRISSLAIKAVTATKAEESLLQTSQDGNQNNNKGNSNSSQQFNSNSNIIATLHHLRRYRTQKDIETAIVRLGRKGRTNEALQLYHAVWTLDSLRQQLRTKQQKQLKQQQKKEGGENAANNTKNINNDDIQLDLPNGQAINSPSLIQYISKSKLRPTTRLLNSAIDACARSSPPAQQNVAFQIYKIATSPINEDGTKKSGGALSPNVFTFGSLLACCARNGDVDTSLELLKVLERGEEYPDVALNEVIYSTVISSCERADVPDVKLALDVLNRGIERLSVVVVDDDEGGNNNKKKKKGGTTIMGVVGYNAAISTMARAGEWRMAVQLLGEMILHSRSGTSSSSGSMNSDNDESPSSVHSASSSRQDQQKQEAAIISRSNPNFSPMESIRDDMTSVTPLLKHVSSTATSSVTTSSTTADDGERNENVNRVVIIPKPDEVTFGTVLAACERSGQWEELLNVAKAATEYGVRLDGLALTSVLHSCQQLGLADEALEYLELMKHLADDDDQADASSSRTTNGRRRKGARKPLRGPDSVAYRLAISACARAVGGHRWQDGIRLLHEMRDAASQSNNTSTSAAPDVVAYTAAIAGCSEAGEYTHAMSLISEMRREGIQPNVVTFSAVINACASASAKMLRKREEDDFGGSGVGLDDVRMPMMRALRLLEAMKSPKSYVKPNIVTYNAAIRACAEGLNLDGAFDLLRQLKEDGLEPTVVTYGSLMTACERVGDIEAASKVFRMVKEEEEKNVDGAENSQEGLQVNEIIYGAAISCCRKAQQPERALLLLRKMISDKLSPNTATFNTVIAALSEGKPESKTTKNDLLWEKALAVYKVMKSKHAPPGVTPNRQTYNILVRCLSANLQPGHAESLLIDMRKAGFVPDVDLYTMTVRSYERCGNPMKALGLMESMREDGYDFYEIKVLDKAFKSGVKILNSVVKPSSDEGMMTDGRGGVPTYAMSEETMDFADVDGDEDEYRFLDSLK